MNTLFNTVLGENGKKICGTNEEIQVQMHTDQISDNSLTGKTGVSQLRKVFYGTEHTVNGSRHYVKQYCIPQN